MTFKVENFAADQNTIAVKFDSKALPGLLSKELVVPAGTIAYVVQDRTEKCHGAGATVRGHFEAMLVKVAPIQLSFNQGGFNSQDDFVTTVVGAVVIQPRTVEIDLAQFRSHLLSVAESVNQEDLQNFFMPHLLSALKYFVHQRSCSELLHQDQRLQLYQHLRKELQRCLFESGFDLVDVKLPEFSSTAYQSYKKKQAAKAEQEESIITAQRLEMLRKELDKEALLKDLEAQEEIEGRRKEARLERFEKMRQRMGEDDLKALVMMLDDDSKRAALIKELIEKDLTPEQKGRVKLSEIEAKLESRLKEFNDQVDALTGAVLEARESDPKVRRILAVVGKRVLSYDPSTNLHPEVPKEVFDTSPGSLGYLRSVRHVRSNGKDVYLFGAQRGIYRYCDQELTEFPFPTPPKGKGGANSIALLDGRIYASHSELGVVEWSVNRPNEGRSVFRNVTESSSSVRGVSVGLDGRIYFSAGESIYAFDPVDSNSYNEFTGARDSITAFHVTKSQIIAGTKSGTIVTWNSSDPKSPRAAPVKKKNPIYMLREAQIAGNSYIVVGSKDYTTTLFSSDRSLFREYHAREEIRWVDGGGDFVAGVSRSGYKVFVWGVEQQSEPTLTIRVSDKVQDLWLVKSLDSA